jgi:hypothetical protein
MLCDIMTLMLCDIINCMAVDQLGGWMILFTLLVNTHGQIKDQALSIVWTNKVYCTYARVWWANKFKKTLPVPAQMDREWCSQQELGPLCLLRRLEIGPLCTIINRI